MKLVDLIRPQLEQLAELLMLELQRLLQKRLQELLDQHRTPPGSSTESVKWHESMSAADWQKK